METLSYFYFVSILSPPQSVGVPVSALNDGRVLLPAIFKRMSYAGCKRRGGDGQSFFPIFDVLFDRRAGLRRPFRRGSVIDEPAAFCC